MQIKKDPENKLELDKVTSHVYEYVSIVVKPNHSPSECRFKETPYHNCQEGPYKEMFVRVKSNNLEETGVSKDTTKWVHRRSRVPIHGAETKTGPTYC